MTHTPGLWKVDPLGRLVRVEAARHFGICHVLRNTDGPVVEDELCLANAYLIASAPELLAELKRIVEMNTGEFAYEYEDDWSAVRALIGRAEGEENG